MKSKLSFMKRAHPFAWIVGTMALLGAGLAGIACGGDVIPMQFD